MRAPAPADHRPRTNPGCPLRRPHARSVCLSLPLLPGPGQSALLVPPSLCEPEVPPAHGGFPSVCGGRRRRFLAQVPEAGRVRPHATHVPVWLAVSDFRGNLGVIYPTRRPQQLLVRTCGQRTSGERWPCAGDGRRGLVGRPALVELCDAAEASEHLLCPHVHTTAP